MFLKFSLTNLGLFIAGLQTDKSWCVSGITVFSNVTPFLVVELYRHFVRTFPLIITPIYWRQMWHSFTRIWWISIRIHGVISHRIFLFIVTSMRTPNFESYTLLSLFLPTTTPYVLHFVDRASCTESWWMTNVMHKFSSMCLFLFTTLYMFRADSAHHQERQIVSIQPLVTVILCWWPRCVQVGRTLLPTCTHLGHHHRMTVTRGCIETICLSWWWALSARNM